MTESAYREYIDGDMSVAFLEDDDAEAALDAAWIAETWRAAARRAAEARDRSEAA